MEIVVGLIAVFGLALLINKLLNRIGELERRLAWIEDRSAQANYVRSLEDKEKGWPNQCADDIADVKTMLAHILSENAAQSTAIKMLIFESDSIFGAMAELWKTHPTNNDGQKAFVRELHNLLQPRASVKS